jgi:hypothetical protein
MDGPASAIAYGARTGLANPVLFGTVHDGEVKGAIREIVAPRWRNCWFLSPTGGLTQGDSGAAVFDRSTGAYFGHFVGNSERMGPGAQVVGYVQDGDSIQRDVLTKWGLRFAEGRT